MSNPYNIANSVAQADLVIGAVLIPGAKAPKLITEEMADQETRICYCRPCNRPRWMCCDNRTVNNS